MDEYVSEGKRKYVPLFSSFFYHTSTPLQSNTLARRLPTSSRMSASVLFLSPIILIPLAEEAEEAADSAAISEVPPSAELRTLKEAEESLYKAEHLLTEHDLQIVALDLPERMQLIDSTPLSLYSPSHAADFRALDGLEAKQACSRWVLGELQKRRVVQLDFDKQKQAQDQIAQVLRLYSEEHLEPAYIMKFESRHLDLLTDEAIWEVCDAYRRYLDLLVPSPAGITHRTTPRRHVPSWRRCAGSCARGR